jgi:adenylate kinase family enzyme
MKLILIGNIGAGKTTLANLILEKYKDAEFVSIDGIRKKHGDGTKEKEIFCKAKFIQAIKINIHFQIIELTGVGELSKELFTILAKYKQPILVFHLIASESELLSRTKKKKWDTPFPLGKDNIPVAIKYTQEKFKEGLVENLRAKCEHAIFVSLTNNNIQMMKQNLKIIFNKIENNL